MAARSRYSPVFSPYLDQLTTVRNFAVSTNRNCLNGQHQRIVARLLVLMVSGLLCSGSTGCQSLHPFAQRTKARLQSARDWANGGLEAFQCGRFQEAKGRLKRATEQSPEDFRARANLARSLHQSGESAEAIEHLQLAIEQSGNDPAMMVELGQMYLDVKQFSPAMRQAQAALQVDRRFASAWQLQGRVRHERGEYSSALADFQKAAGYDPDRLSIQMDIARAHQANEEPLKALATLEYLLSKHPVDTQPEQAIVAKAAVLMNLGQGSTALATLERASQAQPNSKPILLNLSKAQLAVGQWSQAKLTIARAKDQFHEAHDFQLLEAEVQQQQAAGRQRMANLNGF